MPLAASVWEALAPVRVVSAAGPAWAAADSEAAADPEAAGCAVAAADASVVRCEV